MGTPRKPRSVILHGVCAPDPAPDEADTLVQVAEVGAALTDLGHTVAVVPLGLDLSPLASLAQRRPDAIVNLVEALDGQGRLVHLVPAVLDSLGLAYTGCPAEAVYLTSGKPLAKRLMRAAGIPTADWIGDGGLARPEPNARYIVKSVWEHASIGIDATSVVTGERVGAVLAERQARLGGDWFAERYIDGREFNVSILEGAQGPRVLPIAEMTFVDFPPGAPRIVDYAAKWDPSDPGYRNTVRRFDLGPEDGPLLAAIEDTALACWRCFGLRGYARVDFRVDESGRPWVLEVNTNPCLSADAGFVAAAGRAGLSQRDVVALIVSPYSGAESAHAAAAAE